MLMFSSRVSRDRHKVVPELTEADLKKENSNEHSQIYLDPYEYRVLFIC